jgi:hypothetical protein
LIESGTAEESGARNGRGETIRKAFPIGDYHQFREWLDELCEQGRNTMLRSYSGFHADSQPTTRLNVETGREDMLAGIPDLAGQGEEGERQRARQRTHAGSRGSTAARQD